MALKLTESAQTQWRAVSAPHLVALVSAGAGLPLLRVEGVVVAHIYPRIGILTHDLSALRKSTVEYFPSFC
jgi:hypothetical protein